MNNEKFSSQVCTSVEQSKRLLELGLKPETADCFHWEYAGERYIGTVDDEGLTETDVPAWSLHRLIEMCNKAQFRVTISIYNDEVTVNGDLFEIFDNTYDNLISVIEFLIKEGHFYKEYLKQ